MTHHLHPASTHTHICGISRHQLRHLDIDFTSTCTISPMTPSTPSTTTPTTNNDSSTRKNDSSSANGNGNGNDGNGGNTTHGNDNDNKTRDVVTTATADHVRYMHAELLSSLYNTLILQALAYMIVLMVMVMVMTSRLKSPVHH